MVDDKPSFESLRKCHTASCFKTAYLMNGWQKPRRHECVYILWARFLYPRPVDNILHYISLKFRDILAHGLAKICQCVTLISWAWYRPQGRIEVRSCVMPVGNAPEMLNFFRYIVITGILIIITRNKRLHRSYWNIVLCKFYNRLHSSAFRNVKSSNTTAQGYFTVT